MEISHIDAPAMSADGSPAAPKSGRFFTRSVTAWALLALFACLYLATLATKSETIAAYLPSAPDAESETTAAVEAQEIRDNIERLQVDVERIKTDLAGKTEQDKAVATRLAVLEETKRGLPPVASLAPVPGKPADGSAGVLPLSAVGPASTTPAAAAAAIKAAAKKAPAAVAKAVPAVAPVAAPLAAAHVALTAPAPVVPAAPLAANAAAAIAPPLAKADTAATASVAGVKLINTPLSASSAASRAAPAAAPVAATVPTAPVAAPAAAAPANAAEALAPKFETGSVQNLGAPATAGAKPIGIYIGSGPSIDSLRLSWSLLSDRNAETLRPLQPRYTTGIDANGLNYGLVAGPLNSAAEAQKVCKDLAAKAVTCRVGDFAGEAL